MKKANDIHIAIKTCLSFYNEKTDCNSDISAKDIYDEILTTKHHEFCTTDKDILYPLSSFITKIDDISDCDIVITCDNTTAQLAISLGKYCIIITDKNYSTDKHCVILNINDKNIYAKIGKAYLKFTKEIQQNIYDENYKYYLQYQTCNDEQTYLDAIIATNDRCYHVAIWLLNDIINKSQDISTTRLLLKLNYKIKNFKECIKLIVKLQKQTSLTTTDYIKYFDSLLIEQKYSKLKYICCKLIESNLFLNNEISLNTKISFFKLLTYFVQNEVLLENYINSLKHFLPEEQFYDILMAMAVKKNNYIEANKYFKALLKYDYFYYKTPTWLGEKDKDIIIIFPYDLGNSIFYLGSLQNMKSHYKNITLCCNERLHAIIRRSFSDISLINGNENNKEDNKIILQQRKYDYQISAQNILPMMKIDLSQYKPQKFLQSNKELKKIYRQELKKIAKGKKIIGISNTRKNHISYFNWTYWQPILEIDNVVFVNLEYKGKSKKYLQKFAEKNNYNLITWQEPHPIIEFDEFTTLVSACDIIVCGQTTLAHQAGALGIPSFVILKYFTTEFDGVNNDKSVWYENQYHIRPENNKRPNYKKMMNDASQKIKNYIDKNFS